MQKSSFTRRVPASSVESGTRPGLHGQMLISSGHSDLDRLLGGGLPIGSLVLITEDLHSSQHLNLIKYFMAEGVALGQRVAWVTSHLPPGGPSLFLPSEATHVSSSASHAKVESEEASSSDLKIAWQYQKYIKEASDAAQATSSSSSSSSKRTPSTVNAVEAGISRVWCRTFDLTQPIGDESIKNSGMVTRECCSSPHHNKEVGSNGSGYQTGLDAALETSLAFIQSFVPPKPQGLAPRVNAGPESVGRLVVQSLGTIDWRPPVKGQGINQEDDPEIEVLRLMIRLKAALREARCTAIVTLPRALFSSSAVKRMQHVADCVLSLETISDDSEVFKLIPDSLSASALLSLIKMPSVGACVAPRVVDGSVFVVRNKRKKISITTVEIDPDAEDKQGKANTYQDAATGKALDF